MRHLIYIVALALATTFAACESNTTDDNTNNVASITLTSNHEINISMSGGAATITYTTTGDVAPEALDITTTATWLEVTDATTLGEIIVEAATNPTGGTRMAAVTITFNEQVETVIINQSGTPDEAVITPTSPATVDIDAAGQSVAITYTLQHATDEGQTYAKFDAGWIYRVDTSADGVVTLHIATNDSQESRSATIEIGYERSSFNVELTQSGAGDRSFKANYLTGYYYGEAYASGAGNYYLIFSDRGLSDDDKCTIPYGTYYRIDAYGPVFTDEASAITLPEGDYTFEAEPTYSTWTFVTDYTDFFVNSPSGKYEEKHAVESGTMRVRHDSITLELVIEGKRHNITYTGDTEMIDLRGDANVLSTLDDDYALDLSHHSMIYACQGDWYDFGYMNWVFQIKPENGVGDCLQIDIITEHSDEAGGFAGTYTASDVRATNAFMLGWVYGGYMECSWFYTANQSEMAPLRGGTVTVAHNDDGTYTVDIDVTDDIRNRIHGSWTGIGTEQQK